MLLAAIIFLFASGVMFAVVFVNDGSTAVAFLAGCLICLLVGTFMVVDLQNGGDDPPYATGQDIKQAIKQCPPIELKLRSVINGAKSTPLSSERLNRLLNRCGNANLAESQAIRDAQLEAIKEIAMDPKGKE